MSSLDDANALFSQLRDIYEEDCKKFIEMLDVRDKAGQEYNKISTKENLESYERA